MARSRAPAEGRCDGSCAAIRKRAARGFCSRHLHRRRQPRTRHRTLPARLVRRIFAVLPATGDHMRLILCQTRWSGVRRTSFALCTVAATLLAACSADSTAPGPITALPRALSASEQQLITASNGFAFALLRQLNQDTPADSNIFVSPLSASMALGMTMNGAAGATLDSMRAVLGFA